MAPIQACSGVNANLNPFQAGVGGSTADPGGVGMFTEMGGFGDEEQQNLLRFGEIETTPFEQNQLLLQQLSSVSRVWQKEKIDGVGDDWGSEIYDQISNSKIGDEVLAVPDWNGDSRGGDGDLITCWFKASRGPTSWSYSWSKGFLPSFQRASRNAICSVLQYEGAIWLSPSRIYAVTWVVQFRWHCADFSQQFPDVYQPSPNPQHMAAQMGQAHMHINVSRKNRLLTPRNVYICEMCLREIGCASLLQLL